MSELKPCPFCKTAPIFPEAKDVFGTCYDAGCEECGIASISIQIIDCFDYPRDHVNASWNKEIFQYDIEYIEVARQEAIADWNRRAPEAVQPCSSILETFTDNWYGKMPSDAAIANSLREKTQAQAEPVNMECPGCHQNGYELNAELSIKYPVYKCRFCGSFMMPLSEQAKPIPADLTDDRLREIWRRKGGSFHGPRIETGTMPEVLLLKYLRSLYTHPQQPAEPQEPVGYLHTLMVDGEAVKSHFRYLDIEMPFGISGKDHGGIVKVEPLYRCMQTQRPAIPAELTNADNLPFADDVNARSIYVDGWNDCRNAMLAAAPGMGE